LDQKQKILPDKPRTQEHQNKYEQAKQSAYSPVTTSHDVIKVYLKP
jgi:hypothetical protein